MLAAIQRDGKHAEEIIEAALEEDRAAAIGGLAAFAVAAFDGVVLDPEVNSTAQDSARTIDRTVTGGEGIHLTCQQVERVLNVISDINIGAMAAHRLAVDAGTARGMYEVGGYLTGVENIAKVACRKCDVLAELLESRGFGAFADEFKV